MLVRHASKAKPGRQDESISEAMTLVSEKDLRAWVKYFSIPRHYHAQPIQNRQVAEDIAALFTSWGYDVSFQGEFYNVVARPKRAHGRVQLVAAHFDSTPETPGADDNASAVAAMLGCAKALATAAPDAPVMFVSFNREEDGLVGSADFVEHLSAQQRKEIACVQVLEMVGFASDDPNSQITPPGLPINIPTTGNFLGLLSNKISGQEMNRLLGQAKASLPSFPVMGLHVLLGFEKILPVLLRSDHAPFWEAGIPSVMWTDTSEFRNPHYHLPSDLPETLNYAFLRQVTQLLIAAMLTADVE